MNNASQNSQGSKDGELNIPKLELRNDKGQVFINISGKWFLSCPERPRVLRRWKSFLKQTTDEKVFNISCGDILHWDTSLVVFLREAIREFEKRQKIVVLGDLPVGLRGT